MSQTFLLPRGSHFKGSWCQACGGQHPWRHLTTLAFSLVIPFASVLHTCVLLLSGPVAVKGSLSRVFIRTFMCTKCHPGESLLTPSGVETFAPGSFSRSLNPSSQSPHQLASTVYFKLVQQIALFPREILRLSLPTWYKIIRDP